MTSMLSFSELVTSPWNWPVQFMSSKGSWSCFATEVTAPTTTTITSVRDLSPHGVRLSFETRESQGSLWDIHNCIVIPFTCDFVRRIALPQTLCLVVPMSPGDISTWSRILASPGWMNITTEHRCWSQLLSHRQRSMIHMNHEAHLAESYSAYRWSLSFCVNILPLSTKWMIQLPTAILSTRAVHYILTAWKKQILAHEQRCSCW